MNDLNLLLQIANLVELLDESIETKEHLSIADLKEIRKTLEKSREQLLDKASKKQQLLSMVKMIQDL